MRGLSGRIWLENHPLGRLLLEMLNEPLLVPNGFTSSALTGQARDDLECTSCFEGQISPSAGRTGEPSFGVHLV